MTIDLPEDANAAVVEALEELVRRAQQGFTGGLVFDLKDGVPMSVKTTESRRFGLRRRQHPLTVGG